MSDPAEQLARRALCVHCSAGRAPVNGWHEMRSSHGWSGSDRCGYEVGAHLSGPRLAELIRKGRHLTLDEPMVDA